MTTPESAAIAPMGHGDVERVTAIAAVSFPTPWDASVFTAELDRAWALLRVLRPTPAEPIAAFINFWWVRDEIQLLNIATDPAQRRRGYARLLVRDLLDFGETHGVRQVSLEVRPSNEAAQGLYTDLGFQPVGTRPRYYKDTGEDALIMAAGRAASGSRPGRPRPG